MRNKEGSQTSKSSSARVLQLSLDRERKAMANGFVFRRKQEDAEEIPTGCALQRRRGDRKSTDRPAVKIQQDEETKKKPPLASQPNHHSLIPSFSFLRAIYFRAWWYWISFRRVPKLCPCCSSWGESRACFGHFQSVQVTDSTTGHGCLDDLRHPTADHDGSTSIFGRQFRFSASPIFLIYHLPKQIHNDSFIITVTPGDAGFFLLAIRVRLQKPKFLSCRKNSQLIALSRDTTATTAHATNWLVFSVFTFRLA